MGAKLNEKKSFRKKFLKISGYHMWLSSFLEIFENALPFATGSCQNFKPEVLVECKAPIMLKKFPFINFP